MIARYTALIAGLAGLALAINYANSGYNVRVGEPDLVVTELPFKMARWTGDEQPILDDTVRVLNAHSFINRVYRDDLGREITMHAAVWAKPDLGEIAPHHPEVCYTAAGWQIMSRRIVYANDMRERPVELISFQKEGNSVVTAHFYQIGDSQFTDGSNLGRQILRLWGRDVWPCTVKVLLQTNASDLDAGQRILMPFAIQFEEQIQKARTAKASPSPSS